MALLIVAGAILPNAAFALTDSLALNGASSQFASVSGGSTLAFTNNFTIEGWFYFTTVPTGGGRDDLIAKWNNTAANCSWYLHYDGAGTMGLDTMNGTTGNGTSVSWTPSVNTWYFLAVTFSSGSENYYVNGVQQGTTQSSANTSINANSGSPTYVGADRATGSNYYTGDISVSKIWGSVRTQSQVAADECLYGTAMTNMLAEWSLDSVYTDDSGNVLTLTSSGSPSFTANVPSQSGCGGSVNISLPYFKSFWW